MKIIKIDEELELRQIQLSDAEHIFNAINTQRDYLGKWLPFVQLTKKLEDSRFYVESIVNVLTGEQEYVFTIWYQGKFSGLISFNYTDKSNKRTEIGYWLCKQFQGKGIMTKSVSKLCEFAYTEMDINRIQINCAEGNEPSKKIPIRLGFQQEGVEREGELLTGNQYVDIVVYSKLRKDWSKEQENELKEQEQTYSIREAKFSDIEELRTLYKETILFVNAQDYTIEETMDWASCGDDLNRWVELINDLYFIVAEDENGQIAGFASVSDKGYLHSLFIHKDFQRQGVAELLYENIEEYAQDKHLDELISEVSITAKPFFLAKGFFTYEVQNRKANKLYLKNYKMSKQL